MKRLDLVGQKFGRLLVLEHTGSNPQKKSQWKVQCECGNFKTVTGAHLTDNSTQSCGCLMREIVREKISLPDGVAARNRVLHSYRKDAKQRALSWDLSFEEFLLLTSSDCHYCGASPGNVMGSQGLTLRRTRPYNGSFIYNGIDRKDNSRGYSVDNTVSCCAVCNRAKRTMSYDAFVAYLVKAGTFQLKRSHESYLTATN